jgi:hypothetical protein
VKYIRLHVVPKKETKLKAKKGTVCKQCTVKEYTEKSQQISDVGPRSDALTSLGPREIGSDESSLIPDTIQWQFPF